METQGAVQTAKGGNAKVAVFIFAVALLLIASTYSFVSAQTTDEWDNDGTTVFPKPEFETVQIGTYPGLTGSPGKLVIAAQESYNSIPFSLIASRVDWAAVHITAGLQVYPGQISIMPKLSEETLNPIARNNDMGILFGSIGGLVIGPNRETAPVYDEAGGGMRITFPDGDVGIGISEPNAAKLHVVNERPEDGTALRAESRYHTGVVARSQSGIGVQGIAKQGYGGSFDGAIGVYSNNLIVGPDPFDLPPGYEMAVDGKIIAEEVTVMLSENWADFVFDDDYKLMPLNEVEQHIKKNKHLPGIPTAEDVDANGVGLADMQAKLLQKIEELTLYVIDLKKENEMLKARVGSLENRENESTILTSPKSEVR